MPWKDGDVDWLLSFNPSQFPILAMRTRKVKAVLMVGMVGLATIHQMPNTDQ